MPRNRSTAAQLVDCSKHHVPPEDYLARIAERDARAAADNRTEAQRWLGDPPPERSALAQRRALKSYDRSFAQDCSGSVFATAPAD